MELAYAPQRGDVALFIYFLTYKPPQTNVQLVV